MKSQIKVVFTLLVITGVMWTQSCKLFNKSEFVELTAADLTTLSDTLLDYQRRGLAQNVNQRKQIIQAYKQTFSLAQAAEAEGIQKTEKFKQLLSLNAERLLVDEHTKRNQEVSVSKEEADAYYAANKAAFEGDLKLFSEGQKQVPNEEQKEALKSQWGKMKIHAQKARQAGLEKDPGFMVRLKFSRAQLLANLYSQSVEERHKLTTEEKNKYILEHPEADIEKIKQKAEGLLERVKKGESFEKIADEVNEDGTKGRGGDLNWFGRGKMDPEFEKAAFALGKGQTSELVKSGFGYHIIRVDDKRKVNPPAAPSPPAIPGAPPNSLQNKEPQEEVHARHIYLNTQEAETFERRMIDEKVKRALEDTTLKYPVTVPPDFLVKVTGLNPNQIPGIGGSQSGPMRPINPNDNK